MKKLLSILSICLVFISCTSTPEEVAEEAPIRLLNEVLTEKGDNRYIEGKPFTGVAFDVYYNGDLAWEGNYEAGKLDGLRKEWDENGQLLSEANYKDGEMISSKSYRSNGQLDSEYYYTDGEIILFKVFNNNGQLKYDANFEAGEIVSGKDYNSNGEVINEYNFKDSAK